MTTINIEKRNERGISVEAIGPNEISLQIFGPDQDATEFLKEKHFQKLVSEVLKLTNWKLK